MGIATDLMNKVRTGNAETDNLGSELAGKSDMLRQAKTALSDNTSAAPSPAPAPKASSADRISPKAKYGDKSREKRMDVREAMKPLGSFKQGTSHVPQTGMYKLHEGEAVIPKEANTMDAKTAMAGITGKAKPAKKIHKIVTHKTDDGKLIHTHLHHHPQHHPDETHVSNNMADAQAHMAAQEPNMSAQPPEMPEAPAGPTPGM